MYVTFGWDICFFVGLYVLELEYMTLAGVYAFGCGYMFLGWGILPWVSGIFPWFGLLVLGFEYMFLDWGILPWAGAYDLGLGYMFMAGVYPSVGVYFPGLWEIFLGWGYTPGLGYIPLSWDI